jgi:TRAP-type C4-dicarboxylate transport system permease small subunit
MRFILNILISIVAGISSAVVGWFAGYVVGGMMESNDHSLGTGLPTVWLMYVLALVFAVVGFLVCIVWRFRTVKPN